MTKLLAAIVDDDLLSVRRLLKAEPALISEQIALPTLYDSKIFHWIYRGDTALHLAAAGYRVQIVELLLAAGANPNADMNHRQSTPLHYASDGFINGPEWDSGRQVETIRSLLDAGAQKDAQDKNGATPLHRAVRTRCAEAVRALLQAGGNPVMRNKSGSTAFHLAVQNTGRGGSGTELAKLAQKAIIEEFVLAGVSIEIRDGKGRTVLQCAQSSWIEGLLRRP
jgi:ankyrin repeat protein